MRFSEGKITSFKGIMNEFFYDWGMTSSPQIHKEEDGFWINKTSLFTEDGKIFLTYKTSCYEVDDLAYKSFESFYNMYQGDLEFENVLDMIESEQNKNDMVQEGEIFKIGSLSFSPSNFKYWAHGANFTREINKSTFQKIQVFYALMTEHK